MKYLIARLAILSCAAASYSQPKSDAEKSGLLGRVKSVEFGRIEYPLRDGRGVEGKRVPIQFTAFYNAEGAPERKVVTSLDGKGNEIARSEFAGDGSPRHSQLKWYDKNKLLRTVSGESSVKFEYDAKGNWTRKTFLIRPTDSDRPEAHGAEYRIITYH